MTVDVSILIPTYQAELFIDRTLTAARQQSHAELAILVSVDLSSDRTREIARAHRASDPRLQVYEQHERLGWAGNVNFLLERVRTPFSFIYFHDDLISPHYTERLLLALQEDPTAASVHCDMAHFGGSDHVTPGRANRGNRVERLLTFMLAPARGAPLRSMMRASLAGHLRLKKGEAGGFQVHRPFLLELMDAGPALHVGETLYQRWDQRKDGLTDSWLGLGANDILAALRSNTAEATRIVYAASPDSETLAALVLACWLWTAPLIQALEERAGKISVERPEGIHPAFGDLGPVSILDRFGPDIHTWARDRDRAWRDYFATRIGS